MNLSETNPGFTMPTFRKNHFVLKKEITNLKRNNKVLQYHNLYKICEDVEKKIFDFDEDPKLSILQNKVRKLDTGSELCKELCLLQRHFSNLEIGRAVSEVMEEEKYEKISRKIMLRKQLELKREKFFKKQAASISEQCSAYNEGIRHQGRKLEEKPSVETVSVQAEALQSPNLEVEDKKTSLRLHKSGPETARIVGQEIGNLVDENLRVSNMGETRVTDLQSSYGDITVPEIEARKTNRESEFNVNIDELERVLENWTTDLEKIPTINEIAAIPEMTNGEDAQSAGLKDLRAVCDTRARRKKRCLPVFDLSTNIRNYSKRARRLNASINVERVQVYEGPPSILHAFTIGHVLETPAVNNGYCGAIRSSVIQRLYSRHQKTEQTCDQVLRDDIQQRNSLAPHILNAIEEETGPRQESRSDGQKSLLLDNSTNQTDGIEMREAAVAQTDGTKLQLAHLTGTPVSKIVQEEIVPGFIEVSDLRLPRLSRISDLQDKILEEPTADTCFKPKELSAPREKWREFKYVRKCLEEIWMEKEKKKLEKSASLREVLEKEHEWGKENMLTLLRIVDKMSLRREVVIKGHGVSVIIQPFEMPFVTEKQYSLREHAPRF